MFLLCLPLFLFYVMLCSCCDSVSPSVLVMSPLLVPYVHSGDGSVFHEGVNYVLYGFVVFWC